MVLEELTEYGLERMGDSEISAFLAQERVGTLALPTGDVPYMVPLSFGYDGDGSLYFTYLTNGESRKLDLTESATRAAFLVYHVESMFNWRSVSLTGTLTEVPQHTWGDIADVLESAWRPELFQAASMSAEVRVFRFDIDSRSGVRHTGLAEGFQEG